MVGHFSSKKKMQKSLKETIVEKGTEKKGKRRKKDKRNVSLRMAISRLANKCCASVVTNGSLEF